MDEIYLTIKEYAAQENVSPSTVRRWLKAGLIFGVKIKGRIMIPADEVSPRLFDTGELTDDEEDFQDGGIIEKPDDCNEPCGCDTPDGVEILSAASIKASDLRKHYVVYEDAVNYASGISVPTEVFRREEDCRYQVRILY